MSTNVKQLTIHNTASVFRNINNVIIVPSKNKNLCQQSSKDYFFFLMERHHYQYSNQRSNFQLLLWIFDLTNTV